MRVAAGQAGRIVGVHCRVVVHGHVDRVAVSSETRQAGVVIVRGHHADLMRHGAFGHRAGRSRIGIDDTHGQAQFERIGKLAPLLGAASVDVVGRRGDRHRAVGRQHVDGRIELLEELVVDGLLRIVGDLQLSVGTDLRVGNRPVGVRHTVHGGHLDDIGDGQDHRIVGLFLELAQVRVERRNDEITGHEYVGPVVRRIVIRNGIALFGVRVGKIAALRTAQQAVGELRRIDVGRNHTAHDTAHRSTEQISVGLHLVLVRLVRIAVDLQIVGRAGATREQDREKKRFPYVFHNGSV